MDIKRAGNQAAGEAQSGASVNWYKHYLGDYARKTAHLSLLQHGAYCVLLQHYYAIGEPFKNEPETWFRITRAVTQEETQAVSAVVREYFPLKSDGLRHNKRCDDELKAWNKQAEFNRKVGALGGRPRNPTANPTANPSENPHQKLEARSQKLQDQKHKGNSSHHPFTLPADLDPALWTDFLEMRSRIRKPATDRAKWLIVGKLANLEKQGFDQRKVLQQSIRNSWQDVFPVRSEKS